MAWTTPAYEVGERWQSINDPVPEDAAKAADMAKKAEAHAKEVVKMAKAVKDLKSLAQKAAPGSIEAAQNAREQSIAALNALDITASFKDAALQLARDMAHEVVEPTLDSMIKEARKEAKAKAEIVANQIAKEMVPKSKAAAAAAMKPYMETETRAAGYATQYATKGDMLAGKSAQVQMDAQMVFNEANQWMSLGDNAKAEKLRQQAFGMMNLAMGFSGTANRFYGAAADIMKHVDKGEYVNMAKQAAYHAEVMINPDAPPPPPPLVLAQLPINPWNQRPKADTKAQFAQLAEKARNKAASTGTRGGHAKAAAAAMGTTPPPYPPTTAPFATTTLPPTTPPTVPFW